MSRKIDKELFVEKTREWFQKHAGYKSLDDAKGVIGISGGKDSSVVATLLKEALRTDKIYGILMPNGEQKDIQDSKDLIDILQINSIEVNIENAVDEIVVGLDNATRMHPPVKTTFGCNPTVTTNLPARLRMATLYAIANHINGRVIGTGNKAEILCGYYTLWGDGSADFDPIADLYVDEVIELGRQLGLPDRFILKTPDDGMSGISDEKKLGFRYFDVKTFYECPYHVAINELDKETFQKIWDKIGGSNFKRNLTHIPYINLLSRSLENI